MKKAAVVHPFLAALFPVLSLYAHNIQQFPLREIVLPAAYAVGLAAVGWAGIRLLVRDWQKSGVIVSAFAVLFFSFEHAVRLLSAVKFQVGSTEVGTAHLVTVSLGVIFAALAYVCVRTKRDLNNLTRILNFTALCMVVFPSVRIAAYEAKHWRGGEKAPLRIEEQLTGTNPEKLPNIYYIILDAYGREDNLKEIYGYDNSAFVEFLRSRGFYVADESRSNYSHTRFSLASSLNMEYLDELAARVGEEYEDNAPVEALLKGNRVEGIFEERGYRFASFATGFYPTEMSNWDLYLQAGRSQSEFGRGVLGQTPILSDADKSENDRRRILFVLDTITDLAESSSPMFVFAHITAPHPPYVFGRDGSAADIDAYYGLNSANHLVNREGITRRESMRRYIDQVVFLNSRLTTVVDGLLSRSKVEPIIILQGDHGPGVFLRHEDIDDTYLQDRMSILYAIHLPGEGANRLYETITPVNTFRVILDEYFGLELPLLPDREFFSEITRPYKLYDVTDEIDSEQDRLRYERLKAQDYFEVPGGAEEISRKAGKGPQPPQ